MDKINKIKILATTLIFTFAFNIISVIPVNAKTANTLSAQKIMRCLSEEPGDLPIK